MTPAHAAGNFREPTPPCGVCGKTQEAPIRYLRARADDWRPGNPNVKPAAWIGGFVGAVVLYLVVAAIIGHIVNGNGSPYLS